jgi:hypothetical protein
MSKIACAGNKTVEHAKKQAAKDTLKKVEKAGGARGSQR